MFCLLPLLLAAGSVGAQEPHRQSIEVPSNDPGTNSLTARKNIQLQILNQIEVPANFIFQDQQPASGIDFEHRSVEDSLKSWIPVHYDHGNGIAAADVDGDDLYDLYFTTQLGSNRLYRNLGGGRFEDITEKAGVAMGDRVSVAPTFADIDNDGDPDIYVTTVRQGNLLFVNDGKGHFKDVTQQAGLAHTGHSSGSVVFDFDLDGHLDLFLTNVGRYTFDEKGPGGFYRGMESAFLGHLYPERFERSILYRNLGKSRFEDVSVEVDLLDTGWSGDASFADLNGDRYPDLYVLNMQGDDHYYENQDGKRFVDRTPELFPKTPWGAMGIEFFDYNNDGLLELYLTDMHSDMHDELVGPMKDEKRKYSSALADSENNLFGNAFYHQQIDGTFAEISDLIGAENYWPWGISVADLNADGFEDVFVAASMNYPFRYGINKVLLNNRGKTFLDSEFIVGIEPRRDGRTHKPLFDLDCDGADQKHKICQEAPEAVGKITVVGTLGTRSSVALDLDHDGDLDIVTNEFNDVPQVLVSNLAASRKIRYLVVRLIGTRSNRDGLGALVSVRAGEDNYLRSHDGKSGYLSQSSLPLYFGLGEHDSVDSVEVLWPSGRTQTLSEGITLNSVLEIVED